MPNPFEVEVPSVLKSLMAGQEFHDSARKERFDDEGRLAQAQASDLFASGDYKGGLSVLARAGKVDGATMATYGLAKEKRESEEASTNSLFKLLGFPPGAGSPTPGGASPTMPGASPGGLVTPPRSTLWPSANITPAVPANGTDNAGAPARPEVQPSPRVWGDAEATDAGLYEKQPPLRSLMSPPPTRVADAAGGNGESPTASFTSPGSSSQVAGPPVTGSEASSRPMVPSRSGSQPQPGAPGGGATLGGKPLGDMAPPTSCFQFWRP